MSAVYRMGDLVRATKGETFVGGRLIQDYRGLAIPDAGWGIANLTTDGFTIEILERLPTPEEAVIAAAREWARRIDSPIQNWGDDQDTALLAAVESLPEPSDLEGPK